MKVAVIGGGASGLMAAYTAAQNGHSVTLFERQSRVGRKLLSTGNGRCNLSNLRLGMEHYHGEDTAFAAPAMQRFSPADTLDFFRSLGLVTVAEESGRVYPFSDQAGSVVDVLRFACDAAGVTLCAATELTAIQKTKDGFRLLSEGEAFFADRVIVCCGGLAGGKVGGTKSGYELLSALGHSRTKLFPALVQLKTETEFVRSLKGVRADAAVWLLRGAKVLAESAGEVQFTEYGLSGPAVFEISRAASTGGDGLRVRLDLLRSLSEETLLSLLRERAVAMPALTTENLLTGILHNRLGRTVLRYAGLDLVTPLEALGEEALGRTATAVKGFELSLLGTMGFDAAQVTAGGIRTAEFSPDTLESRLVPGLYAAGEVLDIDGDCGGYNLQWAWASGRLAGALL